MTPIGKPHDKRLSNLHWSVRKKWKKQGRHSKPIARRKAYIHLHESKLQKVCIYTCGCTDTSLTYAWPSTSRQKQSRIQFFKVHVQRPMQACIDPTSKQQISFHNPHRANWMLSQTTRFNQELLGHYPTLITFRRYYMPHVLSSYFIPFGSGCWSWVARRGP
jgi:hypothetical protein